LWDAGDVRAVNRRGRPTTGRYAVAETKDVYEDRRAALIAASRILNVPPDEALLRPEALAGAVVRLAELIADGYFATPPAVRV
jgi:hypothetical protein